jgi:hypothetical protein
MISKIANLNNSKNGFLKYTLYRTLVMKTHLIILAICGILSFPLITFAYALLLHAQELAYRTQDFSANNYGFVTISMFLSVVSAIVIGMLTYTGGVNCYDYFNRREKVDKSWSLPITRRQRFWGDFASGILPIALTYILSSGIGLMIIRFGFPERTLEDNELFLPVVAAGMFAGLLTLISVFIIGVFCAAICGRVYESVAYPALIFGIIPAIIALFGTMVFYNVWQVQIFEQLETVLAGTSPGGFLICFFTELNRMTFEAPLAKHLTFLNPAIIFPFILVNAGFLTGAYYLAKRRGAEKTGQAFAVRSALTIILSLVVFCITAVFSIFFKQDGLRLETVLGMVACTAVAYLILDISAKRRFTKMGTAFLKYAGMLIGSLIVCNVLLASNGFGIGTNVPSLNSIKSVSIDVSFLESVKIGTHTQSFNVVTHFMEQNFTDRDSIEIIRQLNIESNNDPFNNDANRRNNMFWDHNDSWRYMQTITYTLNNGNTVRRNVILSEKQIESMLPLIMGDDYRSGRIDYVDNFLLEAEGSLASYAQVSTLLTDRNAQVGLGANVMRLYEAFKKDYMAETLEQRFNSTDKILANLYIEFTEHRMTFDGRNLFQSGSRGIRLHVLSHYTNLIAELERQGLDVWNGAGEFNSIMPPITIGYNEFIAVNVDTSYGQHDSFWVSDDEINTERTEELVRQLIEVAQPVHLINGPGYTLWNHSGSWSSSLVIPPEYSHIAQELYLLLRQASMARQGGYRQGSWHDSFDSYWKEDISYWVA